MNSWSLKQCNEGAWIKCPKTGQIAEIRHVDMIESHGQKHYTYKIRYLGAHKNSKMKVINRKELRRWILDPTGTILYGRKTQGL